MSLLFLLFLVPSAFSHPLFSLLPSHTSSINSTTSSHPHIRGACNLKDARVEHRCFFGSEDAYCEIRVRPYWRPSGSDVRLPLQLDEETPTRKNDRSSLGRCDPIGCCRMGRCVAKTVLLFRCDCAGNLGRDCDRNAGTKFENFPFSVFSSADSADSADAASRSVDATPESVDGVMLLEDAHEESLNNIITSSGSSSSHANDDFLSVDFSEHTAGFSIPAAEVKKQILYKENDGNRSKAGERQLKKGKAERNKKKMLKEKYHNSVFKGLNV